LQTDTEKAIRSLPILLQTPKDRKDAVEIAQTIFGHCELTEEAKAMLRKLRAIERLAQSEAIHTKDGDTHKINTVTQTELLASSDLKKTAGAKQKTRKRK
jgi:Spy/CpxP family protein refolding chaperone